MARTPSRRCLSTVVLTVGLALPTITADLASAQFDRDDASSAHPVNRAIDTGADHSCRIHADRTITCWGEPDVLGGPPSSPGGSIATVPGIDDAVTIAVGMSHSCAIDARGGVSCWGANFSGQLGNGTTTYSLGPVDVDLPSSAVDVAAGVNHTCAVLANGQVACWGNNAVGQLGDASTTTSSIPVLVFGIDDASSIAATEDASCVVHLDGRASCWGSDGTGQLGNGAPMTDSSIPVGLLGVRDAAAISLGGATGCVVHVDSDVSCWGANYYGNFGYIGPNTAEPTDGPPGSWLAVDVGSDHACAIAMSGETWCWGNNYYGQIGTGSLGDDQPPSTVLSSPTVAIAAGHQHSCAMERDGGVWCWGSNVDRQLVNGLSRADHRPQIIPLDSAAELSVGGSSVCALQTLGTAACWGDSRSGKIGASTTDRIVGPTSVQATGLTSISNGDDHVCATTGSDAICWGQNTDGQLGAPASEPNPVPTVVADFGAVLGVSAGSTHTCAYIFAFSSNVRCWGDNDLGQLGNSSTTSSHIPVTPTGMLFATQVSAGNRFTCAVTTTGGVRCWGVNTQGQLGDGTTTTSTVPVATAIVGVEAVEASTAFACALRNDGTVWCWGTNYAGQLGDGTTDLSTVPVQVSGISTATQIALGGTHGCALLADTTVECWGSNSQLALGLRPTTTTSLVPVVVPNSAGTSAISAGRDTTCALRNGESRCWGGNSDGQLAEGPYYNFPQGDIVSMDSLLPPSATSVVPARLLDTRSSPDADTVDGQFQGIGQRNAGSTTSVEIAGRGGIPDDAAAVVINIAAIRPDRIGFLTFHPCDIDRPLAANLNYRDGITITNATTVGLDPNGNTCIFASADTDLTVDVIGFVPATSLIDTPAPSRLLDSRTVPGATTIDGLQQGIGRRAPESTTVLEVAGRPGVPDNADTVSINVVAVNPAGVGFLTIWPCANAQPVAANLNYTPGTNIGNGATSQVDASGTLCIYSSAETDLVIDLALTAPIVETLTAGDSERLLDTRPAPAGSTIDGQFVGDGRIEAGETFVLTVAGRGTETPGPGASMLNIAAVQPEARGFLTLFPCDAPQPLASNINYEAGANISNTAIIEPDANGDICVFSSATTHVVIDRTGSTWR